MKKQNMKRTALDRKGFTLAELLVTVGIIVVLVAIAIPMFSKILESNKEKADISNVKSTYMELVADAYLENKNSPYYIEPKHYEAVVGPLTQSADGWTLDVSNISIGKVASSDWDAHDPIAGGSCKIIYLDGAVAIDWQGASSGGSTADYTKTQVAGKYIFEYVNEQMEIALSGNNQDIYYYNLFKVGSRNLDERTLTLPNGQQVSVKVYLRDYDSFDDIVNRLKTPYTATLIYNKTTNKLSTMVYWDGTTFTQWTVTDDYGNWTSDDSWTDNEYVTSNGKTWVLNSSGVPVQKK